MELTLKNLEEIVKNASKIYFDMDGVLAKWQIDAKFEEIFEPNYFKNLPKWNGYHLLKELLKKYKNKIYILSAYLTDVPYPLEDKNSWLNKFFPEIEKTHRIFVPYGHDKNDFVDAKDCILIDDFSKNLFSWEESGGIGIKYINGINSNNNSWINHGGYTISYKLFE